MLSSRTGPMEKLSRRAFGKTALCSLSASSLVLSGRKICAQSAPDSRIAGVQIGVITGSFQGMAASDIIPAMLKIGLSEVELQSNHAEALAGAPITAPRQQNNGAPLTLNASGLIPRCENLPIVLSPAAPGATPAVAPGAPRGPLTPEQETAQQKLR